MGLSLNRVEHGSLSGLGWASKAGELAIGLQSTNRLDGLSEENKMYNAMPATAVMAHEELRK